MNKCTGTVSSFPAFEIQKKHIKDALRSYPSGHSSHTMLDATFTSILLVGSVWQVKGWKRSVKRGLISAILLLCLSIPVYVGSSRIVDVGRGVYEQWDYKHRGEDVIAGYLVGVFSGFLAYYLTFGWKWVRSNDSTTEIRSSDKEKRYSVNDIA